MQLSIFLLTCITLFAIAYQDFTTRAVNWIFFPILAIAGSGLAFAAIGSFRSLLVYVSINFSFLLLQFCLLKAWFFFKRGRGTPLIDHSIGRGDIFFLLATCFFFSPVNFILFYLFSLIFSLLLYMIFRRPAVAGSPSTIPLAGLQAGFLFVLLTVDNLLKYSLTSDQWMILKLKL
jgi:hypothetical protein